jgi:hypothetical protein
MILIWDESTMSVKYSEVYVGQIPSICQLIKSEGKNAFLLLAMLNDPLSFYNQEFPISEPTSKDWKKKMAKKICDDYSKRKAINHWNVSESVIDSPLFQQAEKDYIETIVSEYSILEDIRILQKQRSEIKVRLRDFVIDPNNTKELTALWSLSDDIEKKLEMLNKEIFRLITDKKGNVKKADAKKLIEQIDQRRK